MCIRDRIKPGRRRRVLLNGVADPLHHQSRQEAAGQAQGNQGRIHMRTLKQVKCGETVSVVKLTGEGALKRRIMDMGITKGTETVSYTHLDVYKRQPQRHTAALTKPSLHPSFLPSFDRLILAQII